MELPHEVIFKKQAPDTPIAEIALRLIVQFPDGGTIPIGSATLIAGYLAITAKHNLTEGIVNFFGATKKGSLSYEIEDYAVRLIQIRIKGTRVELFELKSTPMPL